jgi:hypothetical protein
MRLTLRTLLAYLDNMLPDEDSKAIGEKLETSEMGSALVHRIRSSTRKMRLSAPAVDGRGIGSDVNTVAEYLDNTLAAERITDFERVCLESDVHLAEVAACHQILTLVLAQPADVSEELRQRMYLLAKGGPREIADSADTQQPLAPPVAIEPMLESPQDVRTRDVPEYLRRRPWNWKAGVMVVVLTLILVLTGLRILGRFDSNHPIIGGVFSPAVVKNESDDKSTPDAPKPDVTTPDPTTPEPATPEPATPEPATPEPATPEPATPEPTTPEPATPEPATPEPATPEPATPDPTTPDPTTPDPTTPEPTTPEPTTPEPTTPKPTTPKPTTPKPTTPEPEPDTPSPATEVGRFLASGRPQFLGRKVGEDWLRLEPRSVLHLGEEFLTLPTYRPQVALTSGLHLTVVGPTLVSLNRQDQTPVLQVSYGRLLIDTAGVGGAKVRLEFQNRTGTATFTNPESTLAVLVRNQLPAGMDPASTPRTLNVRLHATSGSVQWSDSVGPPVSIETGKVLMLSGSADSALADAESLDGWLDGDDLREIDLRASRELEPLLDTERPLRVSLHEQADARQVEVSSLAIQALCQVGMFDQTVASFGDERQHSYWRYHLTNLLDRVAYSPDEAASVEAAFVRLREQDAAEMYKVLWGYSQEQLDAGGAAKLVGLLESEHMDVRVLASETLRTITGGKTHLYRPEKLPIQQKKPIQEWRDTLENRLIRYDLAKPAE